MEDTKDCYKFKLLESIKIKNRTLIVEEQIKCTSTKEVYNVVSNFEDKEQYILKTIYGEDDEALNTVKFYINDKSNYFVEVVDYYQENSKTFLLLKKYHEKTILEYIDHNRELTEQQRDALIANILEIGCHLHKRDYLHADIKPENFFIDKNIVRLGDLESLIELENLHQDTIHALYGTKGYKYSSNDSYALKDEIFAYIATIYYIEVGERLIPVADFIELTKEENPIDAINGHARENINYIARESIKSYLLDILDILEDDDSDEKLDCCYMREHFSLTLPKEEESKISKWKKPIIITTIGAVSLFTLTLLFTQPNSPSCTQAHFIDDQTIEVTTNGADLFYTYTKEKKFVPVAESRYEELFSSPHLFKTSDGKVVECKDGRVRVF